MREAFPGWDIEFRNVSRSERLERPFRITFPPLKEGEEAGGGKGKRKAGEAADGEAGANGGAGAAPRRLVVESYTPRDPGPYPEDLPPQNSVRFTPVQTQAIMSGVQPGLTMVVGPPGAQGEGGHGGQAGWLRVCCAWCQLPRRCYYLCLPQQPLQCVRLCLGTRSAPGRQAHAAAAPPAPAPALPPQARARRTLRCRSCTSCTTTAPASARWWSPTPTRP